MGFWNIHFALCTQPAGQQQTKASGKQAPTRRGERDGEEAREQGRGPAASCTTSRGGSDCVTMLAAIAGNKCRFCAEEIITAHTCAALAADSVQSGGGSCGVEFAAAPRTCVANCTSRPAYVSVLSVGLEGSSVASLMYDASVDRCVDNLLTISPRVLFFAAAGCAKEAGHT